MEKISEELGKELFEKHYKIGHWYRFPARNEEFKYIKIKKFIHYKNMPERVFINGTGFVVLHDMLSIPQVKKDEVFIYCWGKDYIEQHIEMTEDEVKQIYNNSIVINNDETYIEI